MAWMFDAEIWIGLITLTALELVLGIDNVIFISILAGKLPPDQQKQGRLIGLALAMLTRIALLLSLSWMMRLTAPLVTLMGHGVSGRDLILILGGLFLIAKSTHEIHNKLEGPGDGVHAAPRRLTMQRVVIEIMLIDVVFSLDSVITAVGMVDHIGVMIAAIMIAVAMMMVFAGPVSEFVEQHPTVKMLALSFLLLIGVALIADGLGLHIPRGYIYFAMGFSVGVEMLNLRLRGGGRGHAEPRPSPTSPQRA